jgi:hypothetical protein
MIKKKIRQSFLNEYATSKHFSESMDWVKKDLMGDVVKEIIPGVDYILRLDTHTESDPITDTVVFEAQCKAEEVDELELFNRRIITPKQTYVPRPRDVIFNAPATIVLWDDDTKTVVKLMEGEEFNPEVGLAMCFCKKVMGDGYKRWFKDALKKGRWQ